MIFSEPIFYLALLLLVPSSRLLGTRLHQILLLVVSLIFYFSIEPGFVFILIALCLIHFAAGHWIASNKGGFWVLAFATLLNLGLLASLKYIVFFRDSLQLFFDLWGGVLPEVSAWLPVGISFFTFQIQSYLFDVHYKVIKAETSPLRFSLFVMFFPQLVAGPIVKARQFLPQLQQRPKLDLDDIRAGLLAISSGLVLKVVVADNLAHYTAALQVPSCELRHSLNLLVLSWAFMVQVFGDFAGYSSIAIGIARLLGYRLPLNFDLPFLATGFSDFWKRWHISLTQWFKDYVFLRLATRSLFRQRLQLCLLITFFLSGLWHGPHWSYVLWGGLHGCACVLDGWRLRKKGPRWKPRGWSALWRWALTFQGVCFLGIFFYHKNLGDVVAFFEALLLSGWDQPYLWPRMADMLFFMAPVAVMHLVCLWRPLLELVRAPVLAPYLIGLNLLLLCSLWGQAQTFIYFTF